MTKVLCSTLALVALFMTAACGDTAPTQEEFYQQALVYQQTHGDAGKAGATGGDGGVCQLAPSGVGANCDACLAKNCCTLIAACDAVPQCVAIQTCVADCQKKINPQATDARAQYNACGSACYQASPQGVQAFNAASTCVDSCTACR